MKVWSSRAFCSVAAAFVSRDQLRFLILRRSLATNAHFTQSSCLCHITSTYHETWIFSELVAMTTASFIIFVSTWWNFSHDGLVRFTTNALVGCPVANRLMLLQTWWIGVVVIGTYICSSTRDTSTVLLPTSAVIVSGIGCRTSALCSDHPDEYLGCTHLFV